MSGPPIWGFSRRQDDEMRAALSAGWRRGDLWWERLQEQANRDLHSQHCVAARIRIRAAFVIARWQFDESDPRYATSVANIAYIARARGAERLAMTHYAKAIELWAGVPDSLEHIQIQPRARSSLFHLRMEAIHRDTYRANMKTRLGKFAAETAGCLQALTAGDNPPHRLYTRWTGEKPAVFDDTRKILAACLLIAADSVR